MDFLFPIENPAPLTTGGKVFYALCGVSLILAGFINTFLLKVKFCFTFGLKNFADKRKTKRKQQIMDDFGSCQIADNHFYFHALGSMNFFINVYLFEFKNVIMKEDQTRNLVQFVFLLAFLIISPFMRFYREYYTEFHRNNNIRRNSNPESSSINQIFVFYSLFFVNFFHLISQFHDRILLNF